MLAALAVLEISQTHSFFPSFRAMSEGGRLLLKNTEVCPGLAEIEDCPGLELLARSQGFRRATSRDSPPHRCQGCQPRGSPGAHICGGISPRFGHAVCVCRGQTYEVLDPGRQCPALQEGGHRVHGGCQDADDALRGLRCCEFQRKLLRGVPESLGMVGWAGGGGRACPRSCKQESHIIFFVGLFGTTIPLP